MYASSTKLVDGYAITAGYTSAWINMADFDHLALTIVFTGGTPIGTASLQVSNAKMYTGSANGLSEQPDWAASQCNSQSNTVVINDTANLPNDAFSASTASITGAGAYVIEKFFAPCRWYRVVYTAGTNSNTTLDIFATRS